MFIAVNARADVPNSKKGKITPAQNAVINAFALANRTGILDLGEGNRCEAQPSTPVNGNVTVTFKKGYIVIHGRLVECEQNTTINMTLPQQGERNGYIVARYSLGSVGDEEFVVEAKEGALVQNDLSINPANGVYELDLYSYKATSGGVQLTRREDIYISDTGKYVRDNAITVSTTKVVPAGADFNAYYAELGVFSVPSNEVANSITNFPNPATQEKRGGTLYVKAGLGYNDANYIIQEYVSFYGEKFIRNCVNGVWTTWYQYAGHGSIATYASADRSKGTIEERLTAMGFSEGSINLQGATLTKMGKYAILRLPDIYFEFNVNEKTYNMSFTSAETLSIRSGDFWFELTDGSNRVVVKALRDVTYSNATSIGFRIQ